MKKIKKKTEANNASAFIASKSWQRRRCGTLLRHSGLDSSPRTAQQRLRHAQNNPASVNAWDACWNFKNFAPAAPKFPKPQHAPTHCACRSSFHAIKKKKMKNLNILRSCLNLGFSTSDSK